METGEKRIGENLGEVRERIRRACERSGRRPEEVTLIAVSKTKPFEDIAAAWKTFSARQALKCDPAHNYSLPHRHLFEILQITGKMA